MLTIEIKDASRVSEGESELEIYCDREGLQELKRQLNFLEQNETHVHLMSKSWGGNELTEEVQGDGNALVNHLMIAIKR